MAVSVSGVLLLKCGMR